MGQPDFKHRGACRKADPELFFPVGNSGPAVAQARAAKSVCRGCPVLAACRDYALAHPDATEHGIWAGMTADERLNARQKALR
jgi:WhiB family redox-sensing transcriptional regulator